MRTVGIIAEYNPLHNGHIYHMDEAKRRTGADYCIVCMSGNFVQRGEPACADKYLRAEWAVRAGADLVLELPAVYALSGADRFALGGVRTLLSTGILTDLSFGCEESDFSVLSSLADLLADEPEPFRMYLKKHLKEGKSYPRAQADALKDYGAPRSMLEAMSKPNNILALEYLRALRICAPEVNAVPVTRKGSTYHDESLSGTLSSATSVRNALLQKDENVLEAIPMFVSGMLYYNESYPVTEKEFEKMLLCTLRRMDPGALSRLPDVKEGFENVLAQFVPKSLSIDALMEEIKSKRYTYARCKRILYSALLGITEQLVLDTIRTADSPYMKVLAFNGKSRAIFSDMAKTRTAPLILRNQDTLACSDTALRCLAVDALATDLYAIATGTDVHRDAKNPVTVS